MMRLTHLLSFIMALLILTQCDPSLSERTPEPGNADFSRYLAVGNSLTAGYSDNALHREGQINSFPNILAGQMKEAGGGDFFQPLVNPGVGSNAEGEARLILHLTPQGMAPAPAAPQGQNIFDRVQTGPFNNMGIPGARSYHLLAPGYGNPDAGAGNYNPFFARIKGEADPMDPVMADAMRLNPTFFTLWIGNNDVLGYATNGGTGEGYVAVGDPAVVTGIDITPQNVFDGSIDNIVATLVSNDANGVVLNLPDLTVIPFFTTVPWNGLVLSAEDAQMLIAGYQSMGLDVDDFDDLGFEEGQNGFVVEDPTHPAGRRNAVAGEHILLSVPQDSLRNAGWGSAKPIPDRFTLRESQVEHITNALNAFNAKLEEAAGNANLPFIDVSSELQKYADKNIHMVFDGIRLTTDFVEGGIFSLDGVHLTPRGSALVANVIIENINREFGATLSPINISAYEGVRFP